MKRLIVNADDFGMSPGISRGILEAHRKGIVTSTSVMINYPTAASELKSAVSSAPDLGFGLHITLTGGGPPVSPPHTIPTLLTDEGTFPHFEHWLRHSDLLNPAEIEREVIAQFDLFVQAAGRAPDHLDCHYHCLYRISTGLSILLHLATKHDLPIRNVEAVSDIPPEHRVLLSERPSRRMPDHFADNFFDKTATLGDLLLILTGLQEGATELMCHPGYVDDALADDDYREPREAELAALVHRSAREVIKSEAIALIKFSDLEQHS